MSSLRVMRLAAGRGGVSVRPTLPPLSGPRALSYTPLPHRSPDGFVSKVYSTPEEALHDFTDGVKVLVGGFGLAGVPEALIKCVARKGVTGLTVVSNEVGTPDHGIGLWDGQMDRVTLSYVGSNRVMELKFLNGEIELELTPQGTLAERLRAGGAGIPAFYTPAGFGTWHHTGGIPIRIRRRAEGEESDVAGIVSQPKESRKFNGKGYVLEEAITGDFALVKAWKGDTEGNLVFHAAARNFNPEVSKASKVCVAEVEQLLPAGSLSPDEVHLPGIYVDRIVQCEPYKTHIEKLTLRDVVNQRGTKSEAEDPRKIRIAKRAAYELADGMYVNLGIGIPTLVSNYVHPTMRVTLHSENGILGVGPFPLSGQEDAELINAGKQTVSYNPGASIVSSSESFALIRGRHIQLTMLGGLQVSKTGDLANWIVPGKMVKGMGGAMDLVSSGNKVVVVMIHNTPSGGKKIVSECSLPLTGQGVVSKIITELAVFEVNKIKGLVLEEIAPDITVDELKERTDAPFLISPDLKEMMQ